MYQEPKHAYTEQETQSSVTSDESAGEHDDQPMQFADLLLNILEWAGEHTAAFLITLLLLIQFGEYVLVPIGQIVANVLIHLIAALL